MTIHAANNPMEKGADLYLILRHLFHGAAFESTHGGDWEFHGSGTYPGETVITEYVSRCSGDRIKAQAFNYVDGVATAHIFTFKRAVDCDSGHDSSADEANSGMSSQVAAYLGTSVAKVASTGEEL
jgi:hypothetical protein